MRRVPVRAGADRNCRIDDAARKIGGRDRRVGLRKGLETRLPDASGSSNDERDPSL
jgi:hypothetical protein